MQLGVADQVPGFYHPAYPRELELGLLRASHSCEKEVPLEGGGAATLAVVVQFVNL